MITYSKTELISLFSCMHYITQRPPGFSNPNKKVNGLFNFGKKNPEHTVMRNTTTNTTF